MSSCGLQRQLDQRSLMDLPTFTIEGSPRMLRQFMSGRLSPTRRKKTRKSQKVRPQLRRQPLLPLKSLHQNQRSRVLPPSLLCLPEVRLRHLLQTSETIARRLQKGLVVGEVGTQRAERLLRYPWLVGTKIRTERYHEAASGGLELPPLLRRMDGRASFLIWT